MSDTDSQQPTPENRHDGVSDDEVRQDNPESTGPVEDEASLPSDAEHTGSESGGDKPTGTNFEEELAVVRELQKTDPKTIAEAVGLFRTLFRHIEPRIPDPNNLSDAMQRLIRHNERDAQRANRENRPMRDEEGSAWLRKIADEEAIEHAAKYEFGERAQARSQSEWRQTVDYEGHRLRAGRPKQRLGASSSDEEKILYMARRSGVGTVLDVPLYHSGVWVRLRTPQLLDLTNLDHQVSQLKVTVGNDTRGLAFSNISQTITSTVVDFALQFVIESNVHMQTGSDLKERILVPDIPVLLWGLACTIHPQGYPYAHPCMADPDNCHHIIHEVLNLHRLFFTDTTGLSQTQRKLMSRRFTKLTEEEYQLYHSEHVHVSQRVEWFGEFGLEFKVPTLQEYEEVGKEWIDSIIETSQGSFNEPPHGSNRDRYITQLAYSASARQYAHWVRAVYFLDPDDDDQEAAEFSSDPKMIDQTLSMIFSTEDYLEDFLTRVQKYIDDTLISMVAIPAVECPNCGNPIQDREHERFPQLVPLDVLSVFFTLVSRKLS